MTTLDRIELLEKQAKETFEKTEALKTAMDAQLAALSEQLIGLRQLAGLANNRSLSLEMSLTELAKTVTAVAAELTESNTVAGQKILDRILKMNQDEDTAEIENLLAKKILLPSTEVKPFSFVVASHSIVDLVSPESSKMVMEKRVLRLPTPLVNEQLRNDLVGRKVGEQVQINKDSGGKVHILTVKEIYDLNEKEITQFGEAALNG